jgi:hypothetical protein
MVCHILNLNNTMMKPMENKQQTAVDYFFDKIKSNFEHDGDKLESVMFLYAICKEKEREQHGKTWDSALDAGQNRAWNVMRAYDDFDDYYNETYKGGNK